MDFENTDADIVITEIGGTVGDMKGLALVKQFVKLDQKKILKMQHIFM